jgi:hypothetical protein
MAHSKKEKELVGLNTKVDGDESLSTTIKVMEANHSPLIEWLGDEDNSPMLDMNTLPSLDLDKVTCCESEVYSEQHEVPPLTMDDEEFVPSLKRSRSRAGSLDGEEVDSDRSKMASDADNSVEAT